MPWKLWIEYDMTIQNSDIDLYKCSSTLSLGKRKEMQKKKVTILNTVLSIFL